MITFALMMCACDGDKDSGQATPGAAPGFPSRAADLDALPGFQNPPPGYGEVPFWWWTGDPLDKERLVWQIEELHKKGVTGVQVNYAHKDTPGWPTYPAEPEIFSRDWWEMWKFAAEECRKRGMGIGLSGYTIDWPKGENLFNRIIYNDREIHGREIVKEAVVRAEAGRAVTIPITAEAISIRAYPVEGGVVRPGGIDLAQYVRDGRLVWTAPTGTWEVWVFAAPRIPGTLNPVHPLAGKTVIEKFFQPFLGQGGEAAGNLNYFFQDELQFGVGDYVWADDFAAEFKKRKGYDVGEALPALFADIGPSTAKARLDYMDVKVSLSEERYFIPIFNWHHSRGMIYGCDPEGRGLEPGKYGDNFRIQRWYTAPGHDTPGGRADLIKGKVSSSIAALYGRPRVWLEGYHSLGWGAAPERLMYATSENYLYGCNLLNLHGLYYTTHGSFWEWAPPCYHFRMPYWDHMAVFLKYFERLSYLLSQGTLAADVAIMYPVSPVQARMDGEASTAAAFDSGRELFGRGYDFVFMDDQSLERAEIRDGRLEVSGMKFAVLVLPAMKAVRWATIEKALEFKRQGGIVINVGAMPEASDRAGSDDPELDRCVRELFGESAGETKGRGLAVESPKELAGLIGKLLPKAVESDPPVRAMRRKIGFRDVYLVMDAARGSWCVFRSKGRAELWDPWTGKNIPLEETEDVEGGNRVRMPLDRDQAQVIVFTPEDRVGEAAGNRKSKGRGERRADTLSNVETLALDGEWEFDLKPTMDNRWGDFRLPATERMIGAEARIFRYAEEKGGADGLMGNWEATGFDDSAWPRVTHGFGTKFWKLGPLPALGEKELEIFEKRVTEADRIDPAVPVQIGGKTYFWEPYDFSWRWGREGDPGHQGWHGLKELVTDDFICLGKPVEGYNETVYKEEDGGTRYYLWTSAHAEQAGEVRAEIGGIEPSKVYLRGKRITELRTGIGLEAGPNPLLLRYDGPGRGNFVLVGLSEKSREIPQISLTPLSMTWNDEPGLIPYDVRDGEPTPAGWYRFIAPPGLRKMVVRANGRIRVWVNGREATATEIPVGDRRRNQAGGRKNTETNIPADRAEVFWRATADDGNAEDAISGRPRRYEIDVKLVPAHKSTVAIRLEQNRGDYGGSGLPEPVLLECVPGLAEAGDWSEGSVLENYSGGAWYRKTVRLSRAQAGAGILLDLGDVVATAEIRVNGKTAAILVCPPWKVDLTGLVKEGDNRIEVLVYNTLANHYLTIPSRYKGESIRSGLLGPVRLRINYPDY